MLFDRGKHDERWIAERYRAKYRPKRVFRQVEIPWPPDDPIGVGHADLYIPSERTLIEVKSTLYADFERFVYQLRCYLWAHPRAERAVLFLLDPSTLTEELYPVRLADADRQSIEQDVEVVRAAVFSGEKLPPCRLETPSACRHAGCPLYESAWNDWQEPEEAGPLEIPEWARRDFAVAYGARCVAKLALEEADREWERARGVLAELGLEAGPEYRLDGLLVKRSLVAGRETFSLAKAKAAGFEHLFHDEPLSSFVKVSEESERWTVRETA